jgi:hypothetical protein
LLFELVQQSSGLFPGANESEPEHITRGGETFADHMPGHYEKGGCCGRLLKEFPAVVTGHVNLFMSDEYTI